jgi:hypothetical protein
MIIADATPDPKFFWELILSIGMLASIGASLATMISVKRTQKREIHFGFEPASKAEFDRQMASNEQVHRDLFSKIGGVERGAKAHTDNAVDKLSDAISKVDRNVASLENETQNQNAWLARLDAKLDNRTVPPAPPLTRM